MAAKDESGRLLSKVAKFVRNPLKDWSELDAEEAQGGENGYSREMLKEMIERRQRNDFVRRREFDMLRKLRQREAAGGRDAGATPSQLDVSSTHGKTEGRALTLKKIDEIEEQMSQQWWKGRGPNGEPALPPSQQSGDMSAQHARAYADTVPGIPNPGGGAPMTQHTPRPGMDGVVEEASIRFAHGDAAGAEAILLQGLAPDGPSVENADTWLTLLDLYRATGDSDKFNATATRYAQRIKKLAPEWLSLRALAANMMAATAADAGTKSSAGNGADWTSPQRLTRDSLLGLTRALTAAGPVWTFDWSALQEIAAEAAGPLRALFVHWADSPVQLRFISSDTLQAVLNEATPVNDRGVDVLWWQLHMAVLRSMGLADDFELVALNYCITYEVSPPPWEDPKGSFAAVEGAPAAATSTPEPAPISLAMLDADAGGAPAPSALAGQSTLVGEIVGESHETWQRLDAELAGATSLTVSCAALLRMDFAAAGTLLNWVTAKAAKQQRVYFVDAHRLLAAFFKVIGIAEQATVATRQN